MKGKGLGIGGSIVSLIFSFMWFVMFMIFKSQVNDPSFIEAFKKGYQNSGGVEENIQQSLDAFSTIATAGVVIAIVFVVLGIVALIASLVVNQNNKKTMGIILIVISIIHIFTFRILAFILLLIGGIQLTKEYEDETPQRDDAFFNEIQG